MATESSGSTWLSLTSLVIAGIALGWNIYRDLVDRGRLRVSCYIGTIGQMGVGVVVDNLLVWAVTNVGRQPVMVSQIGGRRATKPSNWLVLAPKGDPLPKMLKPGEYYTGFTDDLSMIGADLQKLCAYDTLNRRYCASKKQVQKVITTVAEKREEGKLEEQPR